MTDHVNKPPEDLDPEAILANSDHATLDETEAEADQAESTGRPAFETGAVRRSNNGQQILGSPLEEGFSNESVSEHISRVKNQLGVINSYLHNRAVEKIRKEEVIELTRVLVSYQLEDMKHVLMLSMSAQKARRFVQYLEATDGIRTQLQEQSAKAQLSVVDIMFDQRLAAFRAQRERNQRLATAYHRGDMNKPQYSRALRDSQELTDQHEMRLNHTAEVMIMRHSEFLEETLKLFATNLISSGKI